MITKDDIIKYKIIHVFVRMLIEPYTLEFLFCIHTNPSLQFIHHVFYCRVLQQEQLLAATQVSSQLQTSLK